MVDEEVESILREIRERVRAEQQQVTNYSRAAIEAGSDGIHVTSNGEREPTSSEVLARIDAYLTTTARAWDRLPPVVSNRTGRLARLELWVKRLLKRATRWYAWEQVNFNAAVHHALRDTLTAISDYEQQLSMMRSELGAIAKHIEEHRSELNAQRSDLKAQRTDLNAQQAELNAQRAELNRHHEELGQLTETEAQRKELYARMLDEQRVCFKQLSLETTETSILLDRVRREMESRLDKLETTKRKP